MEEQPRPVMLAFRIITGLSLLVGAGLPGLLLFGLVDWTAEQMAFISGFNATALGIVAYVLGLNAETKVTPVDSPRDNSLVPLVPIAGDGFED